MFPPNLFPQTCIPVVLPGVDCIPDTEAQTFVECRS